METFGQHVSKRAARVSPRVSFSAAIANSCQQKSQTVQPALPNTAPMTMSAVASAPSPAPATPQQQQQQSQQHQQLHVRPKPPQPTPPTTCVPRCQSTKLPPPIVPSGVATKLTSKTCTVSAPSLASCSPAAAPRFAYADRFSQDLLNLYGAYYATIGRDVGGIARSAASPADAPPLVAPSVERGSNDGGSERVVVRPALPQQQLQQQPRPKAVPPPQQQNKKPQPQQQHAPRPVQSGAVVANTAPQHQRQMQQELSRQLQAGAVITRPPPQQQQRPLQQHPLRSPLQGAVITRPPPQQQPRPPQQSVPRPIQANAGVSNAAVQQQHTPRPLQTGAKIVKPVPQQSQQPTVRPSQPNLAVAKPASQQQQQAQLKPHTSQPLQTGKLLSKPVSQHHQQQQQQSRVATPVSLSSAKLDKVMPQQQTTARQLQSTPVIARPAPPRLSQPSQAGVVAARPTQLAPQHISLAARLAQASVASTVTVLPPGQPRPPPPPTTSASTAKASVPSPSAALTSAPAGTSTLPTAQKQPPPPAAPSPVPPAKSRPTVVSQKFMAPRPALLAPLPTPVLSQPGAESSLRAALAHLERMYGPAAVAGLYDDAESALAPAAVPPTHLIPYARRPTRAATSGKSSGSSVAAVSAWLQRPAAKGKHPNAVTARAADEMGGGKGQGTAAPAVKVPTPATQTSVQRPPLSRSATSLPPPEWHNPAYIPRKHKQRSYVRPFLSGPPPTPSPRAHPYTRPRQPSISLQHQNQTLAPVITGPLYEGDVYNLLFSPQYPHTHLNDPCHSHVASDQSSIVTVAPLAKRARRTPFAREAFTAVIGKWMRGLREKDGEKDGKPGPPSPPEDITAAPSAESATTGTRAKTAGNDSSGNEVGPPAKKRRHDKAPVDSGGEDALPHLATPRVSPSASHSAWDSHGGDTKNGNENSRKAGTPSSSVVLIAPQAEGCRVESDEIQILAESPHGDRDDDLAALEAEAEQIRAGTHPSLLASLRDLQSAYDERVRAATARLHHETKRLAADYDAAAALGEGTYRDRREAARRRMSDALLSHAWELEADEARAAREANAPPPLTVLESHAARVAAVSDAKTDSRLAPWLTAKFLTASNNIIVPRLPVGVNESEGAADVEKIRSEIALAAAADVEQAPRHKT
ncbi:hypothetical protein HDU89_002406 [Geranomyces variabilis]|nr:hypothetical protein HDU89_002406 [Geranomyces variabilis]